MSLNWAEVDFVRNLATSVKWQIEKDIEAGKAFERSKNERIKQAEATWKHLRPEVKQAARNVCWSIAPADLSKRTHDHMADEFLAEIEKHRGKRVGLIERAFYRLTGQVFHA